MASGPGVHLPNISSSSSVATFQIIRVLGEGAYGEVKLVVDGKTTQCAVAMKCMDLSKHKSEKLLLSFRKEALLQRKLSKKGHENVIRYIGMRMDDNINEFQIFLEYADGGELFDRIEPDVGMPVEKAQFYFRQLIEGLQFIHSNGIAHRDIKPENLLLTKTDILKISDFGMATVFKHCGQERMLDASCGTLPYASPDVLKGKYRGEPADLWSAGVVLVALLAGELPWDTPEKKCVAFTNWMNRGLMDVNPWKKIDNVALSLLRIILNDDENTRATVDRIKSHPWFTHDYDSLLPSTKRRRVCLDGTSQPMLNDENMSSIYVSARSTSFSQPENIRDMLITQSVDVCTQTTDPLTNLAKRMTRFCVSIPVDELAARVGRACAECGYNVRDKPPNQMLVQGRVMSLVVGFYPISIADPRSPKIFVDFRRSRGDGLDFKRAFHSLKRKLSDIICKNLDYPAGLGLTDK